MLTAQHPAEADERRKGIKSEKLRRLEPLEA
jgi:hypothetical protein